MAARGRAAAGASVKAATVASLVASAAVTVSRQGFAAGAGDAGVERVAAMKRPPSRQMQLWSVSEM
jgi:hypothetical protein